MIYICLQCGHEYDEALGDPDHGIAPGTAFASLPADWSCSYCGASVEHFAPEDE